MAEIDGTTALLKESRSPSSVHKVILPRNLPITASNIASQLPNNGITDSEESLEAVRNGVKLMNSIRGQAAINKLKGGQSTRDLADLLAELELGANPTEEQKKEFWATRSLSIENGVNLSSMGSGEGECIVFDLGLTVGDLGNLDAVSQAEAKDRALWLEREKAIASVDDQSAADSISFDDAEIGDQVFGGTRTSKRFDASEPFAYEPLDTEAKEIRLIRLCRPERCTSDGHMILELNRYPLDSVPPYLALSYAWRSPVPTESIICNGGHFKITASLDCALRRVFTWREDIYIWADGICINQNDIQERGAQVRIMGDIYRSAQLTAAYLGEPIWAGEEIDGVEADELPFALVEVLNRIWRGDAGHEENGPRTEEQWKELQVPSDESELKPWKSLIFLCSQSWFTRSWVLQEVALAKSVVVFYGNAVNELECLTEFWKHATRRDLPPALRHGLIPEWKTAIETSNQLNVFRDLRERGFAQPTDLRALEGESSGMATSVPDSTSDSGRSLLSLLIKNRQAYATDDRDKVYSLLSLASDAHNLDIVPNYSIDNTASKVFRDVAGKYVNAGQGVTLLHHAGLPRSLNLPSWVPDWSIKARAPLESNLYHCSNNTKPQIRLEEDDALIIQGAIFDAVHIALHQVGLQRVESGRSLPEHRKWILEDDSELPQLDKPAGSRDDVFSAVVSCAEMMTMLLDTFPTYPTGEDALKAVWRTLVTDRDWLDGSEPHKELWASYDAYREVRSNPWADMEGTYDDETWKRMWPTQCMLIEVNQGYRFGITACGFVGLFPNPTKMGDLIAIFPGTGTPFVIRPREDGAFTLVGECYVHGVMYGELFELAERDDERTIEDDVGQCYHVKLRRWNAACTEQVRSRLQPYFDPEAESSAKIRDIQLR